MLIFSVPERGLSLRLGRFFVVLSGFSQRQSVISATALTLNRYPLKWSKL